MAETRRSSRLFERTILVVLAVLLLLLFLPYSAPTKAHAAGTVQNQTELEAALADPSVTDIVVVQSFDVDDTFDGEIVDSKTIKGDAGLTLTIGRTAATTGDLFTVKGGGNLTIENLTLSGKLDIVTNRGALVAVEDGGSFTLGATANLVNNVNTSGSDTKGGAAIYNQGITTLLAGSTISGNTLNSTTGNAYGAAIYNSNSLKINGGTITDNSTGSSNNVYGAAIYNAGEITMDSGTISQHLTTGSVLKGGGVYNDSQGEFVMNGGVISGNTLTATTSAFGGGVYNSGVFTFNAGEIINNTAEAPTTDDSYGGGLANVNGSFTSSAGLIGKAGSGNTATQGGGVYIDNASAGSAVFGDGAVSGNQAVEGGGIYLKAGTLGTSNAITVSYNTAEQGGGVYFAVDAEISGLQALNNTALASNKTADTGVGGGIYIPEDISVTLNASKLQNNTATPFTPGGGVYGGLGGGAYVSEGGTLTLKDATEVLLNLAVEGGGVYSAQGSNLNLTPGTFVSENRSYIVPGFSETGRGGGVASYGTFVADGATLSNNSIESNDAEGTGGALYVGGTASMSSVSITGNSAQYGGGIAVAAGATLQGTGLDIRGNSGEYGGGITNMGTTILTGTNNVTENSSIDTGDAGGNILNMWIPENPTKPELSVQGALTTNGGILLAANPKTGERSDAIKVTGSLKGSTLTIDGFGQVVAYDPENSDRTQIDINLEVDDIVAEGTGYKITDADYKLFKLSGVWIDYELKLKNNKIIVVAVDVPDPPDPDPDPDPDPVPDPDPDDPPVPGPTSGTGDSESLPLQVGFFGTLTVAALLNLGVVRRWHS